MAAPSEVAAAVLGEGDGGGFGSWLDGRLEALGVDRAVYAAYILGVLQEEEEEEKLDALQGILSAFLVSRIVRTQSYQPRGEIWEPLSLLHISLLLLLSRRLSGFTGKNHNSEGEVGCSSLARFGVAGV